jgi:hypothetical protein
MNESPDPLNEHANSVHDYILKKDNQSSLSEIANTNSTVVNDKTSINFKDKNS